MTKPCPACSKPMELGTVDLDRTWGGFIFGGTSFPHLFFQAKGRPKVSVLDWTDRNLPAWRCAACGTLVMLGNRDPA